MPFAAGTVLDAVVYTDCDKQRIAVALNVERDYGMWYPVLAMQLADGSWSTWCVAAAENGQNSGWETHGTRLHLYPPESSSPVLAIKENTAEAIPVIHAKADDLPESSSPLPAIQENTAEAMPVIHTEADNEVKVPVRLDEMD